MAGLSVLLVGCKTNIGKEVVEVGTTQEITNKEMDMTTVNELKIEDIVAGEGNEATSGATVSVHYTGKLTDGSVFDSSVERGDAFEFVLGAGEVIEGWDKGVVGMKVGGKRKLTIPPELAYGERGAGGVIPPNAELTFDIELLGIK